MNKTSSPSQPEPHRNFDSLVRVFVHPSPRRYPPSSYSVVAVRLRPAKHERVRQIGEEIEWVPTLHDVRLLLSLLKKTHPELDFSDLKTLVNKPETRKLRWRKFNHDRVRANRRRNR